MFDGIILLTGEAEQGPLSALLCAHNPELVIHPASTRGDLNAIDPAALGQARLIAFASPVIVPADILDALGYGGYNFHPGPPQYPGWAPAHFALYEKASEFGVTVHRMAARVDSGPIVESALFSVPADISVPGLEGLAYAHLAQLFWRLSKQLATDTSPLPPGPLHWSPKKNSRRGYRAICDIPLDISKEELDRRMRIFGANDFGMTPTINLHGIEFRAVVN